LASLYPLSLFSSLSLEKIAPQRAGPKKKAIRANEEGQHIEKGLLLKVEAPEGVLVAEGVSFSSGELCAFKGESSSFFFRAEASSRSGEFIPSTLGVEGGERDGTGNGTSPSPVSAKTTVPARAAGKTLLAPRAFYKAIQLAKRSAGEKVVKLHSFASVRAEERERGPMSLG